MDSVKLKKIKLIKQIRFYILLNKYFTFDLHSPYMRLLMHFSTRGNCLALFFPRSFNC